MPSHGPKPKVVSLVQVSIPEQTSNRQLLDRGSQPRKALARDDFPAPVLPTMTILGLGRSGIRGLRPEAKENKTRRRTHVESILIFIKVF